jgi:tRNA1(Val) A37 N6-methylase TrmN6
MIHPAANNAKQLGSYYTDDVAADFLVRWALRRPGDCRRALDPACGDGVFLRALCRQFDQAGISPQGRVLGADLDHPATEASRRSLRDDFGIGGDAVIEADFFTLSGAEIEADVVVGNPPFVRFHRFTGAARARALACAERHGVRLSGLCSSWAPFVVHSVGVLRPGGQLAMVLPLEATSAVYARPVLDFLVSSFAEVSLITFRTPLFPDLNEGTILVLARDHGAGPGVLTCRDLGGAADLASVEWDAHGGLRGAQACDARRLSRGEYRMVLQHLPAETALLWSRLTADPRVRRLGDVADLGIGYVTGGNDFFHLSPEVARTWAIPPRFLANAVVRSRGLAGLSFTASDWKAGLTCGALTHPPERRSRGPRARWRDAQTGARRGAARFVAAAPGFMAVRELRL